MTELVQNAFADTSFWVALAINQDHHHKAARYWSQQIKGRIVTTAAVVLETANLLSRPAWRPQCVKLIDRVQRRDDIQIVEITQDLRLRGWQLFRDRMDKAWSLTDCISFVVMGENTRLDALTADHHFRQAGFRALFLEQITTHE
jgi:predicted nucleic acid-binding protein